MKRKWTLFCFGSMDFLGVQAHLERQAQRGWELDRAGLLARWKRTERTDLRYHVDLAPPIRQGRERRQEYVDMCAHCGWELAALVNGCYIFKSKPGADPVPIHTDSGVEWERYRRYLVIALVVAAVWLVANMGLEFVENRSYSLPASGAGGIPVGLYWYESWTLALGLPALAALAGCALWAGVHFIGVLIRNRGGALRPPARWAMWVTLTARLLSMLCLVVVLAAFAADGVFTGLSTLVLGGLGFPLILAAVGCFLWARMARESGMVPGEAARALRYGCVLSAALAAALIAAAATPYGHWDHYEWDSQYNRTRAAARYEAMDGAPVVKLEELGMAFDSRFYRVSHTLTPVGEKWRLSDAAGGALWQGMGCASYSCPSEERAQWLVGRLVARTAWRGPYPADWVFQPGEGLALNPHTPLWADEGWYGETADGLSVLVVRVGTLVSQLTLPEPLTDGALTRVGRGLAG